MLRNGTANLSTTFLKCENGILYPVRLLSTQQERIANLENDWKTNPRWKGITRPYSAKDVVRLAGSMPIEHTTAEEGAKKFWKLINKQNFAGALGAVTGNQAMQQVKAGLKAIYISVSLNYAAGATINWAGYQWVLREERNSRPGPNEWKASNVWLDSKNHLHLKLRHAADGWSCAELYSTQKFGSGTYRWFVEGAIHKFDPYVVLGIFTYGSLDNTDEIDIEMAKWGRLEPQASNLFYTVYPRALNTTKPSQSGKRIALSGTHITHQFKWTKDYVRLQSQNGFQNSPTQYVFFSFQTPRTFASFMPIKSVPLHLNLWAFEGKAPRNGREVEIVIHDFKYTRSNDILVNLLN